MFLTNVLKFDFRSWFIEDTVKSEGKMYLSTPIDPIFLVLPYLRKVSTQSQVVIFLRFVTQLITLD